MAIAIIPPLAHHLFSIKSSRKMVTIAGNILALFAGLWIAFFYQPLLGSILAVVGISGLLNLLIQRYSTQKNSKRLSWLTNIIYALLVAWLLATVWMPLGVNKSNFANFFFVAILAGSLIGFFYMIIHFYENILRFLLRFKILFLLVVGLIVYQGFIAFQQTGEEFMPSLDEGSFLLMPTRGI